MTLNQYQTTLENARLMVAQGLLQRQLYQSTPTSSQRLPISTQISPVKRRRNLVKLVMVLRDQPKSRERLKPTRSWRPGRANGKTLQPKGRRGRLPRRRACSEHLKVSMPGVREMMLSHTISILIGRLVGFTGSGQQMRKDPTRSRHIYNQGGEEEGY